ncbi:hypothetical protein AVEN_148025-1, partial [Araneus ventricosus]
AIILFAALAAVNASFLLGHGALVNTGVSVIDLNPRIPPAASLVGRPYAGPVVPIVNHVASIAPANVGHAASYASPLAVTSPALAAPVVYGGIIGHGAAIGLGAPLGLGYVLGKALID